MAHVGLQSTVLVVGVAVAAALALFVGWASGRKPAGAVVLSGSTLPPAAAHSLTVVTWNIHYGCGPALADGCAASSAEVRGWLDAIAAAITAWDADIVALQEVDREAFRTHGIDQLEHLRRATGLEHAAWTTTWDAGWVPHPGLCPARHIGRVLSGQAILSRYPLRDAGRHDLPQPPKNGFFYNLFYLHRAVLEVEAAVAPGTQLRLLDAHLEAFHPDNRSEQARILAELVAAEQRPTILLGDMNTTPSNARLRRGFPDEPDSDMTDPTHDILLATRLEDVVPPEVYGRDESPWLTFPAAAPNRRLDYMFVSPGIEVQHVRTGDVRASDHLPVVAKLRLTAGRADSPM